MNSRMEMLGWRGGQNLTPREKDGRIRPYSFGASWSLYKFASNSEIQRIAVIEANYYDYKCVLLL